MMQILALHSLDTLWGDRPRTNKKNGSHGRGSQSSLQRTEKGAGRDRGVVRVNPSHT